MQADAQGPRDYEDHLYVNTQGLDAMQPADPAPLPPEDSPKKDLFDMRMWGPLSTGSRPAGGEAACSGSVCGTVAGLRRGLPWGGALPSGEALLLPQNPELLPTR